MRIVNLLAASDVAAFDVSKRVRTLPGVAVIALQSSIASGVSARLTRGHSLTVIRRLCIIFTTLADAGVAMAAVAMSAAAPHMIYFLIRFDLAACFIACRTAAGMTCFYKHRSSHGDTRHVLPRTIG